MLLWEKIFAIIKEKGMTQKEFSKAAGIAESTISDWKRKKINPGVDKLPAICEVLDISVEDLLGIETPRSRASGPDYIVEGKSDPSENESGVGSLSESEIKLIESYRKHDEEGRERILGYVLRFGTAETGASGPNEAGTDFLPQAPDMSDSFKAETDKEFQIKKDLVKRLKKLARLSRIRLDESEHDSGLNKHLFKYLDYLGIDKLEYIKNYLCHIQPFMITEIKSQEKWDNAICILDEFYRISLYIKVDATKGEEIIVSFHESNKGGIAKSNYEPKRWDWVYIFADSLGSHVLGTDSYSINLFIMRGVKLLPIIVPAKKYDDEGFVVRYWYINRELMDICNDYLQDLYTSDLDFSSIQPFSSLQQLSFTSFGNDVFSNISMLIDSMLVQKDPNSKQVADAALCIYCNNVEITDSGKTELLETLEARFSVNSIRIMPQIIERVEMNLR